MPRSPVGMPRTTSEIGAFTVQIRAPLIRAPLIRAPFKINKSPPPL